MPVTSIPKLLIVDDEPAQMKALCNTLENEGYSAAGFTSATAALTALREETFDLLLSDLMMPEMDGIVLLRAAREIDPNLVGIVMTGHGRIDTAVRAMQAGALDYILKPFKLTAILPVLARALAVRQLRMENIQLHEAVGVYKLRMDVALACDLDTVLQKIADAVVEQSQAQAISILLPTEDGHELRVAVTRGENTTWVAGACIPFSAALTRWVEDNREIFARTDKADVRLFSAAPLRDIPSGIPIPMLAGGKFVGILHFSSERALPMSGGQSKALNLLASTAASAIERASLLARVGRAEQRYRRLAENAPDIVFRYELSPRPRVTYINPAVKAITGYSPQEYYADPKLSLKTVHPEDRALMEKVLLDGSPGRSVLAMRWVHRNGTVIWMEQRHILVEEQDGRLAVEGIARDITERKLADEKIRRTLREKEVMLNEIHHRVKNNLQVVSSLLNMQAAQVLDPIAQRMFIDSQNRIQSMALIHQHLDMSSNFAEIDFGAYLRSLANHVLASYAGDAGSFGVALDASTSASLNLSQAIPCGLIVNELVSNSLKHSFHGRPGGEVRVGFEASNGICTLTVDDDGSPLPDNLFADRAPTMGVQLVQALTSQLGGELRIGDGPKFRITFSDQHGTAS
jgi:PAS domain S-box-containing protein